jgi:hypothetical protein
MAMDLKKYEQPKCTYIYDSREAFNPAHPGCINNTIYSPEEPTYTQHQNGIPIEACESLKRYISTSRSLG